MYVAQIDVPSVLATRTWDTIRGFNRDATRPGNAVVMSSATHTHGVVSLSLYSEHLVDLDGLQVWPRDIMDDPHVDIMRIKGIVRCPQYAEAVIVQGVYQWFDMRLADGCGSRDSILVVIGRGLQREAMLQSWANCQATPKG